MSIQKTNSDINFDENDEISLNYDFLEENNNQIEEKKQNKNTINNNINNRSLSPEMLKKVYPKRINSSNIKFIRHTNYSQQKQNNYESNQNKGPVQSLKRKGDAAHLDKQAKKYQFPKNNMFFLYSPDSLLPDLNLYINQIIEIRISKEFINRNNQNIIKRNLYGQDCYSSNSDAVCQLIHNGFVTFEDVESESNKNYQGVSYFVKVMRSRKSFTSLSKNQLVSRTQKGYQGLTLKPEKCVWVTSLGKEDELKQAAAKMSTQYGKKRVKQEKVPNLKVLIPIPEVNIVFNMNNDPAYKFSIINICDKSSDIKTWTSYKLKTQVLYLENQYERYEIARIDQQQEGGEEAEQGKKEDDNIFNWDYYRFSKVNCPEMMDNEFMETVSRPLSKEFVQVIYDECDWSQFLWGSDYIKIKDFEFQNIKSFKYYSRTQ